MKTLSTKIKRHIGIRILLCILLLFSLMVFITVCDVIDIAKAISYKLINECQYLSEYIISQTLVNNPDSIQLKLDAMNKNSYHYVFFNKANASSEELLNNKKILWDFPIAWSYIYSVKNIDGEYFGYIRVSGNVLSDPELVYRLVNRLLVLGLFMIAGTFLLYPLNHKIPRYLFVTPLKNLLHLLKNRDRGFQIDVTEPYEIYQIHCEIVQLMEQLQQQSQEAAFGQMAAQVAHDIRSPLSVLHMNLELIQDKIPVEDLKSMQDAVQSVHDIANNLLIRYRHPQSLNFIEGAENGLCLPYLQLESVISQKRQEWRSKIIISAEVSSEAKFSWCQLNSSDLKRILSNLLNNAYEALEGHHERKIKIIMTVETTANKHSILIKICDNGRGMSLAQIPLVMAGISTKHPGKGLGLSSAKIWLEKLGGNLSIESQEKLGTEVSIEIPISANPSWFPLQILLPRTSNIVILDDDKCIHTLWKNRLHLFEKEVHHFYTAASLRSWLKKFNPPSPIETVFLIDHHLRGELDTGAQLLKELQGPHIYLITSHAEEIHLQTQIATVGAWLIPKQLLAKVEIIISD